MTASTLFCLLDARSGKGLLVRPAGFPQEPPHPLEERRQSVREHESQDDRLVQFWFSSGLTSDALSGDQDKEHARAGSHVNGIHEVMGSIPISSTNSSNNLAT